MSRRSGLWTVLLVGCVGDKGPEGSCDPGGSGSLNVSFDEFESAWVTDPGVDVYDADGALVGTFAEDGTTTLPSGTYTVAVRRGVAAADTFAGSAIGLLRDTVQTVCVPYGGEGSFEAVGEPHPSSGRLWATSGETLAGYGGLSNPGESVEADAILSFPETNELRGAAWDRYGNLWVASSTTYGTRLIAVAPGDVEGSGDAAVLVEATSEALEGAEIDDLDLDAFGNLFVTVRVRADGFAGVLVFAEAELRDALMGDADLAVARSWSVGVAPERLLFDADGGYYLSDPGSGEVLYVSAPRGLEAAPADGALTPEASFVTTVDDGTGERTLTDPSELALDETGLWVLYRTSAVMAHVSRSANGSVRSNFTVALDAGALPAGMIRDGSNGVWFGNDEQDGTAALARFDANTGELDRQTTLPDIGAPFSLYFDPPVPLPE